MENGHRSDDPARAVGIERGSPLPESAGVRDEALALLYRVERYSMESSADEIERAIAELSEYLESIGAREGAEGGDAGSCGAPPAGDRGVPGSPKLPAGLGREVAEAARRACLAALGLARGEFEEVLRGTELFALEFPSLRVNGPGSSQPKTDRATAASRGLRDRLKRFVLGDAPVTTRESPLPPTHQAGAPPADPTTGSPVDLGGGAFQGMSGKDPIVWRAAEAMWSAAAALGLFFQENYTGPELGLERTEGLNRWFSLKLGLGGEPGGDKGDGSPPPERLAQEAANLALACDGELVYPRSSIPASLLVARVILGTLASPSVACRVDDMMDGVAPSHPASGTARAAATLEEVARTLTTVCWWSARACVTHSRLLLVSDPLESLWEEAQVSFGCAVGTFGGGVAQGEVGSVGEAEEAARRRVAGRVWLEWGLAQHYFQVGGVSGAGIADERAEDCEGLYVPALSCGAVQRADGHGFTSNGVRSCSSWSVARGLWVR